MDDRIDPEELVFLQRIKDAQDVFVTNNGRKDGTVVGWITNWTIEECSRV